MDPKRIPLDIWRLIFGLLEFEDQICFRGICKYFCNNLPIIDLYHIPFYFWWKIGERELSKFPNVKYLNLEHNNKISGTAKLFHYSLKIKNNSANFVCVKQRFTSH